MTLLATSLDAPQSCDVDELMQPTWPWWTEGNCYSQPQQFNADSAPLTSRQRTARQQAICASCPVAKYCAVDALKWLYKHGRIEGVWAGVGCLQSNPDRSRAALVEAAGIPDDHVLARKVSAAERRRIEVLDLHTHRMSTAQIADTLGVVPSTVTRILSRAGHASLSATDQTRCEACRQR